MQLEQSIASPHIRLRTATVEDAPFILQLRLDPDLSQFVHHTDPSISKQREWLHKKINEEGDYHMIIEQIDGTALGTIAIYDIDFEKGIFEWGRWLIKRGSPSYVAIESVLLCFHLAFDILKLKKAINGVRKLNKRVIAFHQSYGAQITCEDEEGIWFEFTKDDFKMAIQKFSIYYNIAS